MNRLEKLNQFTQKQREFKTRFESLQMEMQSADKEFNEFLEKDLGISGQVHLSQVLKTALETSHEPLITQG